MGLFDFLKPKWKSKDPRVRLAAVRTMGADELGILTVVASTDEDQGVQLAAVERIGNRDALEELAAGPLGPEIMRAVLAKLDRILCELALGGSESVGIEAAIGRIEDLALVERLATEAPTPALRVKAVGRIGDQAALCRIVETNCGKEPARLALLKIDDEDLLARIAQHGANKVTRRMAAEKLATIASERAKLGACEGADLGQEERRGDAAHPGEGTNLRTESATDGVNEEAAREALAAVKALVGSLDEGADELFREAQVRWTCAGAVADTSDLAARFDRACGSYRVTRRAIAEERQFLSELSKELERAEALVGSQDLEQVRLALVDLDRRARERNCQYLDSTALLARLDAARSECGKRLDARAAEEARVRGEALERRSALCAELEELVDAGDRVAAGRRVKELRSIWKELPALPEKEARLLAERFRAAADRFSVRQASFVEEQEWLRWNNRTLKEELCSAMEALDAEEDLSIVAERVKEAQKRWKEIGPAPKAEADALWQRFKLACDRGFERCKPYFDELERRRAEEAEHRVELCRQAELHLESTEWKESAEALKRLQAEWKKAGPIPRKQEEELYSRFRQACDRFFERRQTHFAELDEGRRGIQAEKERLCARAHTLAAEPNRKSAREFRELQAEWKRLGPAPRDVEQVLWEQFRGACDRFFAWLDAGRQENLRKKEALCEELEALVAGAAEDADPRQTALQISDLQKRWMEIGPAPKDDNDAIWERFHKPCHEFFESRPQQGGKGTEAGEGQPADDAQD